MDPHLLIMVLVVVAVAVVCEVAVSLIATMVSGRDDHGANSGVGVDDVTIRRH
ncbi:hypothetical protein AAHS21_10140 [Mycobacterium sp. 050272]|uniref:hypothetical protein n=1 Tax=Mycobacterium sp. 050272 TaxID=3142488 RepID=UPI00319A9FA9